jgi:hypothetical protein
MTAPTQAPHSAASTPDAPSAPIPPHAAHPVVVDRIDRIDHHSGGGERAVPYHCPFCAEEDLRPYGSTHGQWHCRTCLRAFSVRFLGLCDPQPRGAETGPPGLGSPTGQQPVTPTAPASHIPGGTR